MSKTSSTTLEDQIAAFDPSNPEALANLEKLALGDAEPKAPEAQATPGAEAPNTGTPEAQAAKQDEKPATPEPAPAAAEAKPEGATSGVPEPEKVVQARDGKHTIPYSVLERERDRAARAEATAQALTEQIERLQAGQASPSDPAAMALTREDLEQLDQDLPGVAKAIRAQMAMIERLTGTLQTLQQAQQGQEVRTEQARRDEEEAAIAGSPGLAALRAGMEQGDPKASARWNKVVDAYEALRADPEFFHLDTASLINKAEVAVATLYGDKPEAKPQTPPPSTKPQPTEAEIKQAADAKLKEVPAPVPTTLSDIPGGAPPASSDAENLENMSSVAFGQKFMSMTLAQQEAYLARLGG